MNFLSYFRGAVLIMGGITLNTLVCGLLYHPVEQHMKIINLDEGIDNEALTLDESIDGKQIAEKTENGLKYDSSLETVYNNDKTNNKLSNFSHNVMLESINEKTSSKKNDRKTDTILRLQSDVSNEDMNSRTRDEISQDVANEICLTIRPNLMKEDKNGDVQNLSRRSSAIAKDDSKLQFDSSKIVDNSKDDSNKKDAEESNQDNVSSKSVKTSAKKLDKSEKTRFFDLSVLRDPIYLVILISNTTSAISNTNFMILLPSYAIAEGFDKNSSALLLSIVSALDLVGRISGASLSDIDFVPKYYYFVGGLGTSGIALALLPMATSYTMLSFFCGLFGLSSGMYIGITTVILADMLGTEKLSSSYGISLFVNGVLQLIGPPICGVIFENVLSYKPIFLAFGIILILGTALWAVVPIIKRNKKKDLETT